MAVELFPRLYKPIADAYWDEIGRLGLAELARRAATHHEMAEPGATGGVPVDQPRLHSIRAEILRIAQTNGYPEDINTAAFDAACSRYLCEGAGLSEPEALRDEVWSFLSVVVLPDIAVWRFPGRARERMLGGVRNTFQRLWLRGRLIAMGDEIHDPDWDLMSELTEDAFVAIVERPRLAANPILAREFAEGWRRCARRYRRSMESIHRLAARNLMATKAVISLEALEIDEIRDLVNKHFEQAAGEISGPEGATQA